MPGSPKGSDFAHKIRSHDQLHVRIDCYGQNDWLLAPLYWLSVEDRYAKAPCLFWGI